MSPNPRSPRKRRRRGKKGEREGEKKNQTPVNFSLNNRATWILFMGERATLWVNCSHRWWDDEAPCKYTPPRLWRPRKHACKAGETRVNTPGNLPVFRTGTKCTYMGNIHISRRQYRGLSVFTYDVNADIWLMAFGWYLIVPARTCKQPGLGWHKRYPICYID